MREEANNRIDGVYEEENTIDLLELFYAWRKKWWAILLAMVIIGGAAGAYCQFGMPSANKAESSLYITSTDSVVSFADLQIGSALTSDYENIIKSRHVLNKVIDNLQLKLDYEQLNKLVTVGNPTDSRIVTIGVTCEVPEDAVAICNEILKVSVEEIYKVVGTSEPSILDEATIEAVTDVKASTMKYAGIGALLGLILVCGVITVRVVMDTSVKTEDDVEKYLGVPVLAAVPMNSKKTSVNRRHSQTGGAA